jgi:hypothetical protein
MCTMLERMRVLGFRTDVYHDGAHARIWVSGRMCTILERMRVSGFPDGCVPYWSACAFLGFRTDVYHIGAHARLWVSGRMGTMLERMPRYIEVLQHCARYLLDGNMMT